VVLRSRYEDDESTTSLLRSGVYRLSDLGEDEELKRFKGSSTAYSFWGAVKYTTVLTILLWWLPIFGQMIAGFVGGRRAGSPFKAVLAALVPVLVIFGIFLCFDVHLLPSVIGGVNIDPRVALDGTEANVPVIAPYFTFALLYIRSYMGMVNSIVLMSIDTYLITLTFAYIGGVMAQQTRRELEWVSEHGGSRTNIVVGRELEPDRAPLRMRAVTRASRAQSDYSGFESMQPVEGAAEYDFEDEVRPVRATRRQTVEMTDAGAHSRKAIEGRVRTMERQQREVEKRTKRKGAVDGLVARSGSRTKARHVPRETEKNEGNDYQYI
jgi:hypothetical protein